ncbi:putative Phosphatidylinositol N-acetylglucosaminyltransferase subunit A [Paratrimastix pyriformis]|uniref:Phosphatidylinositol N-acetylglucosaminyltransferase subunit A n=1 Tax=Paratrimastix pyriformis TaxID=342808 RepID=A0ABQ8UMI8_9EUKA|nr:putative Phosphatidylinositol N-acetylglucosaminyltransferase subunit A [Paratrimastix pyriformis]
MASGGGSDQQAQGGPKYRICMISDFFYPNMGGVESHIFQLSQCLIQMGHKVVVVTHAYGDRSGVRYMTNGLKVYYIPWQPFIMGNTVPTIFGTLPLLRNIFIREQIQIVHGHQAFSTLCHEGIMHARSMGLHACFTDHSLLGFADLSSILMNKLLKWTLSDIDHVICVSHVGKENTVLRASISPSNVSVIPNSVDCSVFYPDPSKRDKEHVKIVVLSRLVYRKGSTCWCTSSHPFAGSSPCERAIAIPDSPLASSRGGDGPMRPQIEEMREKFNLFDRVEMLGPVPHHKVRDGHIFLNCSLTEAFCIAILEAAAAGLFVVSTDVGGVPVRMPPALPGEVVVMPRGWARVGPGPCLTPGTGLWRGGQEVLPSHMIKMARPCVDDLVDALSQSIAIIHDLAPEEFHSQAALLRHPAPGRLLATPRQAALLLPPRAISPILIRRRDPPGRPQLKDMYSWQDIAIRNERVYHRMMAGPIPTLMERLRRYYGCGPFAGKIFCMVAAMDRILLRGLDWWLPPGRIDLAPDLPTLYRQYLAQRAALPAPPDQSGGAEEAAGGAGGDILGWALALPGGWISGPPGPPAHSVADSVPAEPGRPEAAAPAATGPGPAAYPADHLEGTSPGPPAPGPAAPHRPLPLRLGGGIMGGIRFPDLGEVWPSFAGPMPSHAQPPRGGGVPEAGAPGPGVPDPAAASTSDGCCPECGGALGGGQGEA